MLVQTNSLELARRADAAITRSEMGLKLAEAQRAIAAMEAQHRKIADTVAQSRRTVEECRALLLEIDEPGGAQSHETRDKTGNCRTAGR